MALFISSSPHVRLKRNTSRVMLWVALCLIPAFAVQSYFFGSAVIIQVIFACALAVLFESLVLLLRGRRGSKLNAVLKDNSAIVTALLLALSIPPLSPWWITAIGIFFAIVIAKQLYGGLGFNLFNPAMVAYVVLLISFPVQMTSWIDPTLINYWQHNWQDSLSLIFTGFDLDGYSLTQIFQNFDGVTQATPLDGFKIASRLEFVSTDVDPFIRGHNRTLLVSIMNNSAFLLGGLLLLKLRIIQWRIPFAFLTTLLVIWLCHRLVSEDVVPLVALLFSGATMMGAFFIATDPTTAATTPNGRLIYAAFIGLMTYIIRTWGGFPDGVAFAVLLANMLVPLIDYYTKPRVYGHKG